MTDIKKLKKLGLFRSTQATDLGFTNTDIKRLTKDGILIQLDRGVYQHKDYMIEPEYIEFAIANTRFGFGAVIGGISALFYYNLIENIPRQVWLLVPTFKKTTDPKYRFLRTNASLNTETKTFKHFKITSLERAIIEAYYYSTKIGLDQVMRATALALKQKQTNLAKIVNAAKRLGLESVINRYWEALNGLQDVV